MNQKLKKTALVSALMLELAAGAQAATINVDGVTCNLADAITAANTDAVVGGCSAGLGDDVIELTENSTQTLTSPPPSITSNVTINANNSTIERDSVGYFAVLGVVNGVLTLNDATVTGGQSSSNQAYSGGVSASGSILVLNNCVVTGNMGAGVAFAQPQKGSGIYNSHITNNTGRSGGVSITEGGTLTIRNSTISNNTNSSTLYGGGGISTVGYNSNLNLNIINSTISGNTSSGIGGGGIGVNNYNSVGIVNLVNVTLVANTASGGSGGGVWNENYTFNVSTSLISGNTTSGNYPELFANGGAAVFNLDAYNMIGLNGNAGVDDDVVLGNSDIIPSEASLGEIINIGLADNGGFSPTHSLVNGSPAIDAIPAVNCVTLTDQTGKIRPIDGDADGFENCDIGAYENPNPDIIFEDGFD